MEFGFYSFLTADTLDSVWTVETNELIYIHHDDDSLPLPPVAYIILSNGVYLEDKREDYQNCSVLFREINSFGWYIYIYRLDS